jgi:hypothetical protein
MNPSKYYETRPEPLRRSHSSPGSNCCEQALALIDCLPGTPEEDVGATDDLIVSY